MVIKKEFILNFLFMLNDFILFVFSFFISIIMNNCIFLTSIDKIQLSGYFWIHILLGIGAVIWFWVHFRHYIYRKPFWSELKDMLQTLLIFCTLELAFIAFFNVYYSNFLWATTTICVLILVPVGRIFFKIFLIKKGYYVRDAVIIGTGKNAIDAYNALISERYLGFKVVSFIGFENSELSVTQSGIPIYHDDVMNKFDLDVTQFIIAVEDNQLDYLNFWIRKLSQYKCKLIYIIPTMRGIPLYDANVSFLFGYDAILLRVNNNLARYSSQFLKRTLDILGSFILILFLSPLLLTLYLLIAKDGGKAIYGHIRIGKDKKAFKCLKFRTMVLNSKEVLNELLENSPDARAEWQKDFKLKNDPRVTKIGTFLRKTSLDELPQLFNVLWGQMSLVGPRPIVRGELSRYDKNVDYYLMAKPGMTGLWQVSGRNDVDYEMRVYLDTWYVKNWSLWNDIIILFKTIGVVISRNGAY